MLLPLLWRSPAPTSWAEAEQVVEACSGYAWPMHLVVETQSQMTGHAVSLGSRLIRSR